MIPVTFGFFGVSVINKTRMSEVRFTAEHARDITFARREAFERTMSIIRAMLDTQIKDAARLGKQSIVIEVPRTVFGREPYNVVTMGKELAKNLSGDGFAVRGTCTRLEITWEDRKNNEQQLVKKPRQRVVIDVPRPKRV